jgi:hypothetical protein
MPLLFTFSGRKAYSANLLQEDGFKLLQEDGSALLQEDFACPFSQWTVPPEIPSTAAVDVGGLVWSGTKFWFARREANTNTPELWYSADGATWTQYTNLSLFWSSKILCLAYVNGRLVIVGDRVHAFSTDEGLNWTNVPTSLNLAETPTRLIYGNGIYGLQSGSAIYTSADISSATWTAATYPANANPGAFEFIDGTFYIGAYDTTVCLLCYTSTDLVSWTPIQSGSSQTVTPQAPQHLIAIKKWGKTLFFICWRYNGVPTPTNLPKWDFRSSTDNLATSSLITSFDTTTRTGNYNSNLILTSNGFFFMFPRFASAPTSTERNGIYFLSFGAGSAVQRAEAVGAVSIFTATSGNILCSVSQVFGSSYKISSSQL